MIDRHPNYQIPWARVRLMAGDRPGTTRLTEFGLATWDGSRWMLADLEPRTWAQLRALPTATLTPGMLCRVTDYAYQQWVWDGAYWRPAQGRALLLSSSSGAAGFIAQISGLAAAVFTVSGNKIPAGMIPPQGRILVTSDGFKTGAAAGYRLRTHLGILNSAGDPEITSVVGGSATGSPFAMSTLCRFGQETGRFSSRGGLGEGVSSTAGFSMNSKNTGLNTQIDMFVSIAAADGNVADVYNLVSLQVWLEA